MAPMKDGSNGDWLASLARQSSSTDNKAKQNNSSKRKRKARGGGSSGSNGADNDNDNNNSQGDDGDANSPPLNKAQRIERREQKRIQREERRRLAEEARLHRLSKKRPTRRAGPDSAMAKKRQKLTTRRTGPDPPTASAATPPSPAGKNRGREKGTIRRGAMTDSSKGALARLSTDLDSTLSSHARSAARAAPRPKRGKNEPPRVRQELTNGLPAVEPKGKATKRSVLRPESKELQPRKRDYNGQGLVRPSLFLSFDDPSFLPKFELEFGEHVPGFFGKAKQKAAKKQADEKMLWRKCLKAKEEEGIEGSDGTGGNGKRKKKAVKKLDERVEGMMRTGIM